MRGWETEAVFTRKGSAGVSKAPAKWGSGSGKGMKVKRKGVSMYPSTAPHPNVPKAVMFIYIFFSFKN